MLQSNIISNIQKTLRSSVASSGGGGPVVPPFVSNWDTTNTSAGSSTSSQIAIPTVSGGTYNCVVDWGDGSSSTITTWNDAAWTHNYGSSGAKTIRITGQFWGLQFNNTGDRLKLLTVTSFGSDFRLGNTGLNFRGCENLTAMANDLSLVGVTTMSQMFYDCTSLTSLDVSSWNVSSVTNMSIMFYNANMTNTKYSDTLNAWSLLTLKPNVNFSAGPMKYNAGAAAARAILTGAPNNWTITDGGPV